MRILTGMPKAHGWRPVLLASLWSEGEPSARADRLEAVVPAIKTMQPESDFAESTFFEAYGEAVAIGALLLRWDAAVRTGETDASRHLEAAKRRAEVLALPEHPLSEPLRAAVSTVSTIGSPRDTASYMASLGAVPVPTRVLARRPASRPFRPSRPEAPEPVAVCLVRVDDQPITHAHVVHPDRIYELGMTVRLTRWPEWVEGLRVDLVSVFDRNTIELPSFIAAKPQRDADGLWTAEHHGSFVLHARQALGARPVRVAIAATLTGPNGRSQRLEVLGYQEVRIRAFDASRDAVVEAPSDDERVVEMLSALHNVDIPDSERDAFCRFFGAIVRAALGLQSDRMYRPGKVREARFHDDLERRLRLDPALGRRLERGTPASGGYTDLIHDGIVCELKVEDAHPVTLDNAAEHVGQPTQYSAALGRQLSILCVLDTSPKAAPVGTIGEYIDWLTPNLHGRDEPERPSHVGVIIVNGSQPKPSSWSGRRVRSHRGVRRRAKRSR